MFPIYCGDRSLKRKKDGVYISSTRSCRYYTINGKSNPLIFAYIKLPLTLPPCIYTHCLPFLACRWSCHLLQPYNVPRDPLQPIMSHFVPTPNIQILFFFFFLSSLPSLPLSLPLPIQIYIDIGIFCTQHVHEQNDKSNFSGYSLLS